MTQPGKELTYDVARKGTPLGSYTLSGLALEIDAGRLHWTDDCWSEGMESWAKLHDLKDSLDPYLSVSSNPKPPGRLPLYLGVAGLCVAVVIAGLIMSGSDISAPPPAPLPVGPTPPAATMGGNAAKKMLQAELSQVQDRISTLTAASFKSEQDASGAIKHYRHNFYQRVGNRMPLRVRVEADGKSCLYTYYHGRNWIFHKQLRIIIDGQISETSVIPAHLCARRLEDDNSVTEICRFEGPDDVKLLALMAAAAGKTITFQMIGRVKVEKALSYESKEAIKESHELASLLGRRRELLEELSVTR
jgi:hypothetical protein